MLRLSPRKLALAGMGALTLLLASAAAAFAAIPTTAEHTAPPADYKGWAYVKTDGTATAPAWKWSANGWAAGTAAAGSYVWLWPWGGDWTWAWRDSAWHAMRTADTATWKCDAVEGDNVVYPKVTRNEIPVLASPAAGSANAGTAGLNDRVTLSCGNGFRDARGGTTVYALVKVTSYTWCVPFADGCALNPPQRTTISGYVDATKVADDYVGPPAPGGLDMYP